MLIGVYFSCALDPLLFKISFSLAVLLLHSPSHLQKSHITAVTFIFIADILWQFPRKWTWMPGDFDTNALGVSRCATLPGYGA